MSLIARSHFSLPEISSTETQKNDHHTCFGIFLASLHVLVGLDGTKVAPGPNKLHLLLNKTLEQPLKVPLIMHRTLKNTSKHQLL